MRDGPRRVHSSDRPSSQHRRCYATFLSGNWSQCSPMAHLDDFARHHAAAFLAAVSNLEPTFAGSGRADTDSKNLSTCFFSPVNAIAVR